MTDCEGDHANDVSRDAFVLVNLLNSDSSSNSAALCPGCLILLFNDLEFRGDSTSYEVRALVLGESQHA
jgi:hypothetical protein